MSNLPGKITDPHLSAEEPLTFRRCLRFILQALPHPRHPLRSRRLTGSQALRIL